MGDRSVTGFRADEDHPTLFLYSHWGGTAQVERVAAALVAARPRWNDPSYATRIAVSQMVGSDWDVETGHGLYVGGETSHGADYHHIIVVDWGAQQVLICLNSDSDEVVGIIDFDDFIENPRIESVVPQIEEVA